MNQNQQKQQNKIPLTAVVGPTASGKTSLAVAIAKAKNGEVVSADSMQIYKDMNIGTAKPTIEEMGGIPHHLVGFLDISQKFSVAQYVTMARECIADIHKRGRLPVLAGGTGLYVTSLLDNVQFTEEEQDNTIRARLEERAEKEGIEVLLRELASFDPVAAERLHPNNSKRIIRAIEIYQTTGITMTQHIKDSHRVASPYAPCVIGLDFKDRQKLYDRINLRVDKMMDEGLPQEAKKILSSDYSMTAMNAIGYKELAPWVRGECSLQQAAEQLKQSTRRYAKRQLTWFRRDARVQWIFVDLCSGFDEILEKSLEYMEHHTNMCYDTL